MTALPTARPAMAFERQGMSDRALDFAAAALEVGLGFGRIVVLDLVQVSVASSFQKWRHRICLRI